MFTRVYLEPFNRKKERQEDNEAERQRDGVTEREGKKSVRPQEGPLFENHE